MTCIVSEFTCSGGNPQQDKEDSCALDATFSESWYSAH